MNFNIGDRVIVSGAVGDLGLRNQIGTVLKNGYPILVEFDKFIEGHGGHGKYRDNSPIGKVGHCWFMTHELADCVKLYFKKEKKKLGIVEFWKSIEKKEKEYV